MRRNRSWFRATALGGVGVWTLGVGAGGVACSSTPGLLTQAYGDDGGSGEQFGSDGGGSITLGTDGGGPVTFGDAGLPSGNKDGGALAPEDASNDAGGSGPGSDASAPPTGPAYNFGTPLNPGSCLDALGAAKGDGAQLDEYSCNASIAQTFLMVDAGGGAVRLYNPNAQKCVGPTPGAGSVNGTSAQLWDCDGSSDQAFALKDAGAGLVTLVNQASGRCLEIYGATVADKSNVDLFDCNGGVNQEWNPAPIGGGYTATCGVAQLQAGRILAANCASGSGSLVSTSLDLNACLTNSNGALGWETNGGFAGSCSSCTLAGGSTLTCQCANVAGQSAATTLDLSAGINDCGGVLTCGACGAGTTSSGPSAFSGLYGADGNDFYTFTGQSSIANLKNSGWSVVFLFAASVTSSGDIVAGGTTLATGGSYTGNANWNANVTALKTPPTSVIRYEVTVGGWGDTSYANIQSLINAQGTGSGSILYRNFQALKNAVPGIDAINDDDEANYDIGSSTSFGQMLNGLGMKLTQAPYMNQSFWVQLKNNLGSGCDQVYLQVYQGGAGNDPGNWDSAYGNGFHVVPGLESNGHSTSQFQTWSSADGVTGGFYYPDVTWAPNANWGVFEIANGVGLPPQ